MNTRRDFVRGLTGIGAIVATGHAPAIVKSALAARGTMLGGAHAWTNPYITDGLVAMWDSEWNVGGGVHDAAITGWVDCKAGYVIDIPSGASFGNKELVFSQVATSQSTSITDQSDLMRLITGTELTCEWVLKSTNNAAKQFFNIANSSNGGYIVADLFINGTITHYPAQGRSTAYWQQYQTPLATGAVITMSNTWVKGGSETTYYDAQIHNTRGAYESTPLGPQYHISLGGGHYAAANGGSLYCVRLYSRALTAEEIAHNSAVDKARFNLPA